MAPTATGSPSPSDRAPVVVVAGVSSGVGKTSLAVGLMAALRERGLRVQGFKVGPDFLDPMHHQVATGRPSINLDGWMMSKEANLACFDLHTEDAEIAVVEGVMGLFDGRDGKTEAGSTAQMAKWLQAPVLLVLDCWALSRSAAAMVHGYATFDPDLNVAGTIFNKVGGSFHTQWLREALESSHVKAKPLWGVPKDSSVHMPERYLGLHMPSETALHADRVAQLARLVEEHLDVDHIISLANEAATGTNDSCTRPGWSNQMGIPRAPSPASGAPARVAMLADAAFCFYYHSNLAMLQAHGVQMVPVSSVGPQAGQPLPDDVAGLYIGGGYPELHASELSGNHTLRRWVRALLDKGGVVYAECGGLMYASKWMDVNASMTEGSDRGSPATPASGTSGAVDTEDEGYTRFAGLGLLPFGTKMTGKMCMGYCEVEAKAGCRMFPPGQRCKGQQYHFSEVSEAEPATPRGAPRPALEHVYGVTMQRPGAEATDEGYCVSWGDRGGFVLASYVHLHWGSNPSFAAAAAAAFQAAAARVQAPESPQEGDQASNSVASTGTACGAICSFVPSGTEVLLRLGLADRIVGCTEFCPAAGQEPRPHLVSRSAIDTSEMSPAEVEAALQQLHQAGSPLFSIDTAWLRQTRPSLVLVQNACAKCDVMGDDVASALQEAGLLDEAEEGEETGQAGGAPTVLCVSPKSVEEMLQAVGKVGAAAGAPGPAAALEAELRARLAAVESATALAEHKPRVLSLEGLEPLAVGGGWLPDMKARAGGVDGLYAVGCPAMRPRWDDLVAYQPEVLLLTPCSFGPARTLEHLHLLAQRPGFWELPAVVAGRLFVADGKCFAQPGPGLVDGIEALACMLHPALLPDGLPNSAVGEVWKLEVPSPGPGQPAWPCDPRDLRNFMLPYQQLHT